MLESRTTYFARVLVNCIRNYTQKTNSTTCPIDLTTRTYSSLIKPRHPLQLSDTFNSCARKDSKSFIVPNNMVSRELSTYRIEPEISVKPSGHLLVDDELHITVSGLGTGQEVTVYVYVEEDKKKFESFGWFTADSNGIVDLYKDASLSGTYTGISPMGLFWSMVPLPGQLEGIRMMKKDMDTPFKNTVNVFDGHLFADDIRKNKPTPEQTHVIERWYKGVGVTSHDVTDGRVRGRLFLPPGPGPFPGVIDLFGTVGGLTEFRSCLLASRGFASLALPYFLYKDLPEHLNQLDLDYFLEAVDWLLNHNQVYSDGVGVLGVSKGGDIALMMGAHCPKIRAIVNINGCTFNSTVPIKYSGGDIPEVELQWNRIETIDGIYATRNGLDYKEKDITQVWNNDAKVLNFLSEDDMCSPKECIRMMERLYPKEKADNFTIVAYEGAGHLLEPPYTPLCSFSYHKSFNMHFWWGGKPKPHADAQEDSWRRTLAFFQEHLPKRHSQQKSKL